MSVSTLEFYLARAQASSRDAAAANLDNVRDRHMRAHDAWMEMAERVQRTAEARAEGAAIKEALARA